MKRRTFLKRNIVILSSFLKKVFSKKNFLKNYVFSNEKYKKDSLNHIKAKRGRKIE